MTEPPHTPHADDPHTAYERGRDDFGRALFAAAEAREAAAPATRRRWRFAIGGVALAGGLAALAIGITVPGGGADPDGAAPGQRPIAIGAAPAVAAVAAIRDAMHDRILVREVTNEGRLRSNDDSRIRDWTDLATRDQHVKFVSGPIDEMEYWNPSAHERVSIEAPEYRARDGRRVVSIAKDRGSQNDSAMQSPVEEIDWLLEEAAAGRISIRGGGRPGERVLEATGRCYSWDDAATMECGEGDNSPSNADARWPDVPPKDAEAVRSYQRWWITSGDSPRMLRYENGTLPPTGTKRTPVFTSRWTEWKILPRTEANLALVRPPRFDPATYLVIRGGSSVVSDALKAGTITCTSDRPDFCDVR